MSDSFDAILETLQLDAQTLDHPPGMTLVPPRLANAESARILDELPTIAVQKTSTRRPELEWLEQIGEGGMGRVGLARQVGLERNVAVKTPKSAHDPIIVEGILQEAYVTGLIEHPNVVPVYTLGRDDHGAPLIVMKRIEGTSWAEVLAAPAHSPKAHDLTWHIKVLVQVCNALRYAHRRGIVHRDIKPENIMIGEYGEVYLLDWGIAMVVDGAQNPLAPDRTRARGLAGTPAYMAPEMAEGNVNAIDARTDVYLLGATLYEVLTGQPPHRGTTIASVLRAAFLSVTPTFGPDVPEVLKAVAIKAMARDPDDRFESAEAFSLAVEAFLEHRGSMELTEASLAVLRRLQQSLASGATEELTDLFAECRFGFLQALKQWPENPDAQIGLKQTLRALVRFHIGQGRVSAARAAYAQIGEADGELEAMIDAEEIRRRDELEHLESIKRIAARFDPRISHGFRSLLMVGGGVMWGGSAFWRWLVTDLSNTHAARLAHLSALAGASAIGFLLLFVFRKSILLTEINRRFALIVVGEISLMFLIRVSVILGEVPMTTAIWIEFPVYAVGVGSLGLLFKKRMALTGVPYFFLTIFSAIDPRNAMLYLMVCHLLVFFSVAWVWRPGAAMREELGGA